jgi:hypothetical protein
MHSVASNSDFSPAPQQIDLTTGVGIVSTDTNRADGPFVPADTTDPTASTYTAFSVAFDHFNTELFAGRLTRPMLTIRNHADAYGYYSPERFGDVTTEGAHTSDEIAINPRRIANRPVQEVLSTLVHEMVHQYQHCFGKPSRNGYHNKGWVALMKGVGLQPSSTGEPGGKETGQTVSHYIITGGRFDVACGALLARGFELRWADITRERKRPEVVERPVKYVCPTCGRYVKGEADFRLACVDCAALMMS